MADGAHSELMEGPQVSSILGRRHNLKIQSVRIKNFRALKDVQIDFDSVTTFIGPNGTGKSTVLRALDWFFNGKVGSLVDDDCAFGATDEAIEVQVTFDSLTERDRESLGKYTPLGSTTFTAWKSRFPDGSESLSANAKSYAAFNAVREKGSAIEKKAAYNDIRVSLDLSPWSNQDAASQAMVAWESEHPDQLEESPESLQTNFFGFNGGGKMSGLFDFVLVTADLRAGEESLDGRSSIIGRILERTVDRTAADEEIAKIVETSRAAQQTVYAQKFRSQLEAMTTQLNDVVASYSPGRVISVAPSEVELKAPKTTFEVTVMDGETETAVERQGHGFQRTLLISALQLLAQSGAASSDGVICLAVEEPELFQHPIQAQAFAKVLRSLAEDENKRIQVTYATHSPYFVEARHFTQVRRLTRSAEQIPVVTVHSSTVQLVKERLGGAAKDATVDRQLDGILSNQLAVALFAQRAFVVEGTTESAVFCGLGDKTTVGYLEAKGVAVVPVGGKTSIPLVHAIVTSMGVPTYALFDGDGGAERRAVASQRSPKDIASERQSNITANRLVLRYFGLAEEDFPSAQVSDSAAVFEDHLEAYLAAEWPEWGESCQAVELASGITLAKNQHAYRTATLESGGEIPEMLTRILAKVTGG